MSGPLDNCGLRREVVYADKEVVDMLEDKDAEITRLRAELAEKDELIRETMEALEYISRECIVKGAERFMPCIRKSGRRAEE